MIPLIGIAATLALFGCVAFLLKWVTSQLSVRRNAESLTPEDLKVLEQAAGHLVDEIKQTAVVAVRDLDDRCEELRKLLLLADQRISLWSQIVNQTGAPETEVESVEAKVRKMAASGIEPAEIARRVDLPLGEVNLVLSLSSTARA